MSRTSGCEQAPGDILEKPVEPLVRLPFYTPPLQGLPLRGLKNGRGRAEDSTDSPRATCHSSISRSPRNPPNWGWGGQWVCNPGQQQAAYIEGSIFAEFRASLNYSPLIPSLPPWDFQLLPLHLQLLLQPAFPQPPTLPFPIPSPTFKSP